MAINRVQRQINILTAKLKSIAGLHNMDNLKSQLFVIQNYGIFEYKSTRIFIANLRQPKFSLKGQIP